MIDPEYLGFLNDNGYFFVRDLGDGRWAGLSDFMFTCAIIVGKIGDRSGYDDRWCYENRNAAALALVQWDGTGEPEGWHRHPASGRRRRDGMEEYVNF